MPRTTRGTAPPPPPLQEEEGEQKKTDAQRPTECLNHAPPPIGPFFQYPSCATWPGLAQAKQMVLERIASNKPMPPLHSGIRELPDELWMRILEVFVLDAYDNITVPALAQLARMRRVCRSWKQKAKDTKSPYDAEIMWDGNCPVQSLPIRFCGGVAFGEYRFSPSLTIIRHPEDGRMFAVSSQPHKGFARHGAQYNNAQVPADDLGNDMCYFVVKRFYPLWRLAQLLGGHTAEWEDRLPDLAHMQFNYGAVESLRGRRLKTHTFDVHDTEDSISMQSFVEPKQMKCVRLDDDGVTHEMHNDFISYCVQHTEYQRYVKSKNATLGEGKYVTVSEYAKSHTLVLVEEDDPDGFATATATSKYIKHDVCWEGASCKAHAFERPEQTPGPVTSDRASRCHSFPSYLSIALGLYSCTKQATGCNWLVSLFDHHGGIYALTDDVRQSQSKGAQRERDALKKLALPKWHHINTSEKTLKKMATFALLADKRLSRGCTIRKQRGSAAKAVQKMCRQNDLDTDHHGRIVLKGDSVSEHLHNGTAVRTKDGNIVYDAQYVARTELVPSKHAEEAAAEDPAYSLSAAEKKRCAAELAEDEAEDAFSDASDASEVGEAAICTAKRPRVCRKKASTASAKRAQPAPTIFEVRRNALADLCALVDSHSN